MLEHNQSVGKKIRISGGGRCNFTNLDASPANFISANPHFCKSALARYTPADFVALVESYRIEYYEKKLGQLFCRGSAQQIIDMLVEECARAGVSVLTGRRVRAVTRPARFSIETSRETFDAESIVIATGGLSVPLLGSKDFGYRVARQFNLKIIPPRPALVPLTLAPETLKRLGALSGVSFEAAASCGGAEFREDVLVTHRGLSGPAILQVSSYWQPGEEVTLNLLPGLDALEVLADARHADTELAHLLARHLPRRFAQAWCDLSAPNRPLKQFTPAELAAVAGRLERWALKPAGTEGFAKAEVTAGGVDTDELSSKTMESRRAPGLYFIGEVVDVTGHLGGYNFQWAWASGYAAGQYV
ncbi:MAG: NAD(P)/FAD-dependent oxidoreductase [Acidobacteria bacterium]|nr:NAD(P)/FAD-dependent oxidoreductase [Acidobacteriota bacterium]